MAAAARLTEPPRTSPTARIPGLLVSRNNTIMASWSLTAGISAPVSRNPWLAVKPDRCATAMVATQPHAAPRPGCNAAERVEDQHERWR
jgi:hypothetical protein